MIEKKTKDKVADSKKSNQVEDKSDVKQKYPEGPNEKQGYPDEEKPNRDDLHQEQNIEKDPEKKPDKSSEAKQQEGKKNYQGWNLKFNKP